MASESVRRGLGVDGRADNAVIACQISAIRSKAAVGRSDLRERNRKIRGQMRPGLQYTALSNFRAAQDEARHSHKRECSAGACRNDRRHRVFCAKAKPVGVD